MPRRRSTLAELAVALVACSMQVASAGAASAHAPIVGPALAPAEITAAFTAAGYERVNGKWMDCSEGRIADVRDVNGDGQPEVVITESSTKCYGVTGERYSLVSRHADGTWHVMSSDLGVLTFLTTRGKDGWPDLEIGGPGFCFMVLRWNGLRYAPDRYEFDGKPCTRP